VELLDVLIVLAFIVLRELGILSLGQLDGSLGQLDGIFNAWLMGVALHDVQLGLGWIIGVWEMCQNART
jgi:hypothetical protein